MRAFMKLATVQAKLFLREPMGVFFTLFFGPALLLLMGLIFGNQPEPLFGGLGHLDVSTPAYMALIVGMTGLTTVPISVVTRREMGILRRFAATPLKPLTYFLTDVLVPLVLTLAGVIFLIMVGMTVFNIRFDGQWHNLLAGVILGALAFFSLGYALAGIFPSARTAILVGNVVIIPMNILSGALIPMEVLPARVQDISKFIPLTHIVTLLQGLWFGESWSIHLLEVAVLTALLVVGMFVIALTFRWE